MRRIRRPNLDRQVEGGDDGEITLAAKPFASKCAHILPDGMDPVGVRKTDRHHNEQVFEAFTGLRFILLAEALRIEAIVMRHRWKQDVPAVACGFPWRRDEIGRASCRERVCQYV